MTAKTLSLAGIAAQVAFENAVPFEPLDGDGRPSGLTLQVYSDQNPKVVARLNELENAKRRADQLMAAQNAKSRPEEVVIPRAEDEQRNFARLVGVRVSGWSGLEDEFNEDAVIRLFLLVPDWASQTLAKARGLGRFTIASPTA